MLQSSLEAPEKEIPWQNIVMLWIVNEHQKACEVIMKDASIQRQNSRWRCRLDQLLPLFIFNVYILFTCFVMYCNTPMILNDQLFITFLLLFCFCKESSHLRKMHTCWLSFPARYNNNHQARHLSVLQIKNWKINVYHPQMQVLEMQQSYNASDRIYQFLNA